MAVHEMLGKDVVIDGCKLRIGHLRADRDLGVASVGGFCTEKSPAYLVRLSDSSVVRKLRPQRISEKGKLIEQEDFDTAILEGKAD